MNHNFLYNHNFNAEQILTNDCIEFLLLLSKHFEKQRQQILQARKIKQNDIDNGKFPDFLDSTSNIRNSEWTVSPTPYKLQNRTIEITGPVDRKMIINGLNSKANGYMADFEDSTSPTWKNIIEGHINLRDAIHNNISFNNGKKSYKLNGDIRTLATLFVRPRGLHLNEKNVTINGKVISASLFDFGVYFFTNAKLLSSYGIGPYFYLPKLQNHIEARWWNSVFTFSQNHLNIPIGTVKATVLIEHILSAFEMDEILFELRLHSAGLNCGRWDYIFSFIKTFHKHSVLPDKSSITMQSHFMNSYVKLLVQTCHKRGVAAMGGMAAQIPIKNDIKLNENNLNKVYLDKLNESKLGLDGTWVAHPGLIDVALLGFEKYKSKYEFNQIHKIKSTEIITQKDLLLLPVGQITTQCVDDNINTCLLYLHNWINGLGCVAINHKMEDLATAEISRIQLWNWVQHGKISYYYIRNIIDKNSNISHNAKNILKNIIFKDELTDFITLESYKYLDSDQLLPIKSKL